MENREVDIYLITLSTDLDALVERINLNADKALILSTHHLFDIERNEILDKVSVTDITFKTFVDFITEEEMTYCDIEADSLVLSKYGSRTMQQLMEYYQNIKRLKNEIILKNVKKTYPASNIFLLSEDLGIEKNVWTEEGAKDFAKPPEQVKYKVSRTKGGMATIKDLYSVIENGPNKILFGHKISRAKQYLDPNLKVRAINFFEACLIHRLVKNKKNTLFFKPFSHIATSPHSFSAEVYEISRKLKLPFIFLQDGFLPTNYTSNYLSYYPNIDEYWTWGNLTKQYFEKLGIKSRKSNIYNDVKLPLINEEKLDIKNIVVLTSGSGDWTALKNRSDEDRMFEIFIKFAQKHPEYNINYRPHPLWVHQEHQGVNSINRLCEIVEKLNLNNLQISANVQKEGKDLNNNFTLSKQFVSVNEEIEQSDIVIGDHSQVLITAATMGKVFLSINAAGRESFFKCYEDLGFNVLTSCEELEVVIDSLKNTADAIKKHNLAIEKHNQNV